MLDAIRRRWNRPAEIDQIDLISRGDIRGVAVFSGSATIPREYGLTGEDTGCGLVMIWLWDR